MASDPRRKKLTYADYVLIPNDGLRHEIIEGEHVVNPAAFTRHQRIQVRLSGLLLDVIERPGLGVVLAAPTDVQLSEHDIVQPDVMVVMAPRVSIVRRTRVFGAPDLVVEILSPSTERLDRGRKLALYERAGVVEYWIVDGEEGHLEQFVRRDSRLEDIGRHSGTLAAHFARVEIELAKVWLPPDEDPA